MKSKMLKQIENVKNNVITVEEIVRERLVLLEQHKSCNAVICYDEKMVLSQAKELDAKIKSRKDTGKLCGAVITVKDNLEVKGLKATAGTKAFQNNISTKDCEVVAKLRNEGAVTLLWNLRYDWYRQSYST
jgi:Asp-tRNA(Asn)/Glu-tRNA(Gln) amidotransferase A subunit family amidase